MRTEPNLDLLDAHCARAFAEWANRRCALAYEYADVFARIEGLEDIGDALKVTARRRPELFVRPVPPVEIRTHAALRRA
jgi:hypothetical protein